MFVRQVEEEGLARDGRERGREGDEVGLALCQVRILVVKVETVDQGRLLGNGAAGNLLEPKMDNCKGGTMKYSGHLNTTHSKKFDVGLNYLKKMIKTNFVFQI